jgi:ATP-binding cassette, subfamily B, bacterial MsbA
MWAMPDSTETKQGRIQPAAPIADRRMVRRLAGLAKPHLRNLALAALCQLVATLSFLVLPYIIRLLTDSVFLHHDASSLNRIALLLLAIALVSAVFGFLRGYVLSYVGGRIVTDLRARLYQHLQSLSISFHDDQRVGDLMFRLSSDTIMIQSVVSDSFLSLSQHLLTLAGVVVLLLVLDWRLALIILIMAPLLASIGKVVGRYTRRLAQASQAELGRANIVLEETLATQRIVKAFGREQYERERYGGALERSFRIGLSAGRLQALFESLVLTATALGIVGVLWIGGHDVLEGRLTPGGLIAFLFYLTILSGPIQVLASLYGTYQRAAGSAARVFEILDAQPSIVDAPGAYQLPAVRSDLEIRNLWFAYEPELPTVLREVTFQARPGQTVALVGPSGAGKTTLISLLLRFYDPVSGAILIDGHDIRGVTIDSLRRAIAVVPQEPTLFGGTIRENIAYGRLDADDAAVETAAHLANAHTFIAALPNGYHSIVGERGVKLSGGQRQRIAIARAILKDPRLIILDEATSALDNESEAMVQEALDRFMVGRTTLVIAHRLTTVERADCIVVLDQGRVLEQGSHEQLIALRGLYFRLYTRLRGGHGNPCLRHLLCRAKPVAKALVELHASPILDLHAR